MNIRKSNGAHSSINLMTGSEHFDDNTFLDSVTELFINNVIFMV
jgi:hypothetical protein